MFKLFYPFLIILLVFTSAAHAVPKHDELKPYVGTKEFQKLKKLVGTWEGTSSMEQDRKVLISYELTSGGSAIIETLFPGQPDEMVSVYHDKDGKLSMTHYCALGNQPEMSLEHSDKKMFIFKLSKKSNIKRFDPHINSLKIAFSGDNEMVQRWIFFENGEESKTNMLSLRKISRG